MRIAVAGDEPRYTTTEQLRLERELLDRARDRLHAHVGRARADLVEEAIARRSLSGEQAELVRALTSSGAGIEVVRAPAGAGKTFALDAAREAWTRSGIDVVGCALSARAAAELREQAAIDATTVARLRRALDRGHRLGYRGVVVVDEAGMVGTRELAELARHADDRGAKLVLVGDDRQLPEIEAGGAFRALAERQGALELREVRRQREAWDREALSELREGRPEKWAREYAARDRLVTAPTAPALRARLADDWWASRERGDDALMVALRRRDVADLNQLGRERMRAAERLRGEDVELGTRSFAVGDRVVLARNDRDLDVVKGERGEVRAVSASEISLRLDRGRDVRLPASYAGEHLDHGYAMTAHRVQGATVDRTFVLGSDETYREWGYTALSRHRDSAHFYVTAPAPFLNRPAQSLQDKQELVDTIVRTFEDSRKQELALEAVERDPHVAHVLRELDRAREHARADERRIQTLRDERQQTPWYRRAPRRDLGQALETSERAVANGAGRVDELREDVERLIGTPRPLPEGRPAREVLAHAAWLDRGRALTRDAHDVGLGIDR